MPPLPAAGPSAAPPRDGSTTPPLSMAPAQESVFAFRLVLFTPFWSYGELPREMHFSRDTGTIRVGRLDPEGVPPGKVWANAGFTGERGKLVSAQHAELQLIAGGNVLLTSWSRNGTFVKAEVGWTVPDRSLTAVSTTARIAAGEWFQLIGPVAANFKAKLMLEPERRYTVCFGRPKQGSMILPLQYSLSGDVTLQPSAVAPARAAPSCAAQPARVAKLPAGAAESYLARHGAAQLAAAERDKPAGEAGEERRPVRRPQAEASAPQGPKDEPAPAPASMREKKVREKDLVHVLHEHGRISLKELRDKFKIEKADRTDFTAIVSTAIVRKVIRFWDEDKTIVTLNDSALDQYGLHDTLHDNSIGSRPPSAWAPSGLAAAASASWRTRHPSTGLGGGTSACSSTMADTAQVAPATARPSARPSARPLRRIIHDDNSDEADLPTVPSSAFAQPAPRAALSPWDGDDDGDEEVDDGDPVSGFSSGLSSGLPSPRGGDPSKAFRIPKRGGGGGGTGGGGAGGGGGSGAAGAGSGGGGDGGGSAGFAPDAALKRQWPGATPQGTIPQEWPQEAGEGEPVPSFVMGREAEVCWRVLKRLGRVPESVVVEMSDLRGRSAYNQRPHDQQKLLLHWVYFVRRGTGAKQTEYPQYAGPDGFGGMHVKESITKAAEAARAQAPASTRGIKRKEAKVAALKTEAAAEALAPKSGGGAAIRLVAPPERDLMPLGSHKRRAEAAFTRVAVLDGLDTHVAAMGQSEPSPTTGAPATGGEAIRKPGYSAAVPACSGGSDSVSYSEAACAAMDSVPAVPDPTAVLAPAPAPAPPPTLRKPFGLESSDEDSDPEGG